MELTTSTPQNESSSSSTDSVNPTVVPLVRKKEDFLLLAELGEGSYSTVHLGCERDTSRKFAVKICFKKKIIREKKVQQIFRERHILQLVSTRKYSHPFIVRLYCTFQDRDCLYFVLTLADRKDLLTRLKALGGKLSVIQSQFVVSELCSALSHIHSLQIVHRDVKPENILLMRTGHILLSDFGCAKLLNQTESESDATTNDASKNTEGNDGESTSPPPPSDENVEKRSKSLKRRCSFVGTAQYVSPEVLNGEEVTCACDWWAFGIILFELLAGRRPFSGESEYLLYKQILKLDYEFPDEFPSEDARDLVNQLLVIPTVQRFGSFEMGGPERIRQHPFFVGIDWNGLEHQKSPLFPNAPEEEETTITTRM